MTENKNLYKVLDEGAISPYQAFQYEQGKEYHCKNFDPDESVDCSDGFYATDLEGLPYAWAAYDNEEIWEVQVWGDAVEINEFKRRYEHIKLIRKCDIDEEIIPACKEVESDLPYRLSEVIQPIHPFKMTPPEITENHRDLLQEWASVWDSVGGSVWDSVGHSVRDLVRGSMRDSVEALVGDLVEDSVWGSVWDSVGDSVGRSVGGSVGDSVWAYIGSLFNGIDWEYIEHDSETYPFQSAVDLWEQGLVPSYDGEKWRLHGGEDAEVLFE